MEGVGGVFSRLIPLWKYVENLMLSEIIRQIHNYFYAIRVIGSRDEVLKRRPPNS